MLESDNSNKLIFAHININSFEINTSFFLLLFDVTMSEYSHMLKNMYEMSHAVY